MNIRTFYRDADGNPIDERDAFDDRGVLKNGITVSVPKALRDSLSDTQRAAVKRAARVTDGFGNPAGRRPGHAFAAKDQKARDMKRKLYDAYDFSVSNRWRNQDANPDLDEFFASNGDFVEGAVCTVSGAEYPGDYGSPGHIRGGVCVPDRIGQLDGRSLVNDQAARRKAYADHDRYLENAWRNEG